MAYLSNSTIQGIANAVVNSPLGYDQGVRNIWFNGISRQFVQMIPIHGIPTVQVGLDLNHLNTVKRLSDGTVPIELWLSNAANTLSTFPTEHKILQEALSEVVSQTSKLTPINNPIPPSVAGLGNIVKEKSVHQNDMVSFQFMKTSVQVGTSVARVQVARYDNGIASKSVDGSPTIYLGTGWLIGNGLIITNHHVINARNHLEADASKEDFELQAKNSIIQFDFDDDKMQGTLVRVNKLEAFDLGLDYAILRLEQVTDRMPLPLLPNKINITEQKPEVVNIIQHPFGKPKKVAIRNNHIYDSQYPKVRYFTDTEGGSSGSPVFNDNWKVIALHRAYSLVDNVAYNGKSTAWVNEGVQLEAIMNHLQTNHSALALEINTT